MTDKELLELAAKAAGINGTYQRFHQTYGDCWVDGIDIKGKRWWWNPLVNDKEALQLAMKLDLDISLRYPLVEAMLSDEGVFPTNFATIRLAIVEKAADIGRNL